RCPSCTFPPRRSLLRLHGKRHGFIRMGSSVTVFCAAASTGPEPLVAGVYSTNVIPGRALREPGIQAAVPSRTIHALPPVAARTSRPLVQRTRLDYFKPSPFIHPPFAARKIMNVQDDPGTWALAKFGVGQPVPRTEDPRLVRGQGRYSDDLTLPGQAYA